MITYNNLAELYRLWGKEEKAKEYLYLTVKTAQTIDYKNNKENINKFIYNMKISKTMSDRFVWHFLQ